MNLRRRILAAVLVLLVAAAIIGVLAPKAVEAIGGTELYLRMTADIQNNQRGKEADIRKKILQTMQFRLIRADYSGVELEISDEFEYCLKARNVADPELFKRFVTSRGEWVVLGKDGQSVFPFKYVRKTVMDTKGETPAVVVLLSRPAAGAAGINDGDTFNATMIWDGEEIPLTAKVGDKGKALLLTSPGWTVTQAWHVRAILTLGAYPCEVKVKDFKYGDDILKQIFG